MDGDLPSQPGAEILLEEAGYLPFERGVGSGQVPEAGANGSLCAFKAFGRFWLLAQDS